MNNGHPGPLVLLAEDNLPTAEITSEIIETLGYRVVVAHNGRDALTKTERLRPAVVLMDVQMPEMDGLEATRVLKTNPNTAMIPVACLTAFAMPEESRRCREAGADRHVSKPLDFAKLDVLLRELVAAVRG